jgi:hypothetical protein
VLEAFFFWFGVVFIYRSQNAFNAFNAFQVENQAEWLPWQDCFYRPYHQNLCYVNWCSERGFNEITPGWQHYDHVAHEAWGNTMIDYMNNHPAYDTICKR